MTSHEKLALWGTRRRRPLASYVVDQNTDLSGLRPGKLLAVHPRPSFWFIRARWFFVGVCFAAALFAFWHV